MENTLKTQVANVLQVILLFSVPVKILINHGRRKDFFQKCQQWWNFILPT